MPQVLSQQFWWERCKVEKFPILYKQKQHFRTEKFNCLQRMLEFIRFSYSVHKFSHSNQKQYSTCISRSVQWNNLPFSNKFDARTHVCLKKFKRQNFIRYIDSDIYFCIPLFINFALSSSNINVCFSKKKFYPLSAVRLP